MKFVIEKGIFLEGLNKASKAVTGRVNNPLLEGIHIVTEDGKMTLTGADSNMSIEVVLEDFQDIENGNIIIEPRILGEIVRRLPDKEIEFVTEESLIEIKCGNSNFKIGFKDGAEYPAFDSGAEGETIILDSTELKKAIKEVGFAAAVDDTRPILKGIYFEYEGEELNLVALDGYRLSKKSIAMTEEKDIKVVVEAKNFVDITRLMADETEVEVKITRSYIVFKFDNTTVASRLLDGNYVKYNSLIPTEFVINATSNKANLLGSLERASIMSENNNKLVKLVLENNKLNISAKSQVGKVEDELDIDVDGDSSLTIAFNAKYLLDALKAIDSEDVVLHLSNSTSPCVIKGSEEDGGTHLVLPVRLM